MAALMALIQKKNLIKNLATTFKTLMKHLKKTPVEKTLQILC